MATTPSSILRGNSEQTISSKSVKIDFNVKHNNIPSTISEISEMEVDDNVQIKSSKLKSWKLVKKKITMIGNGHSFESDKTHSDVNFNALECCQFSGTEHICNSSIEEVSALDIESKK
jgi:hypothetical protein